MFLEVCTANVLVSSKQATLIELVGISSWVSELSRRKIGHAHDNSADSENDAGAREPNVHAHFIIRFENGQGNQSFFFYP